MVVVGAVWRRFVEWCANRFGDVVDVIPCSYPNEHTRLSAQLMLRASV